MRIHPPALVEDGAVLGADVEIGPFCIVGPGVTLGDGARLLSHVTVTGITTSPEKREMLRGLGAEPVVADVLDAEEIGAVVAAASPEAIIHEATALAGDLDIRHFDRSFAVTNRLRSEGTDNLLAAGRAAGIRRFIAQSFGGWSSAPANGRLATESDATLAADKRELMGESFAALSHLEAAVGGLDWADGIVLRYGGFYGPGTGMQVDPPGPQIEAIAKRKFPIIGDGAGVWSFIHVADAADATVEALGHGAPGIYNIAEPSPSISIAKAQRELGWDFAFRLQESASSP